MINVKPPFTSIYLYFPTCVYVENMEVKVLVSSGETILIYQSSMGLLSTVYLQYTRLLAPCTFKILIHRAITPIHFCLTG